MSKIHDYKRGGGGDEVSNGYFAVDPSDNLILVPPLQALKDGWRLATYADFPATPASEHVEPAADEPAPAVVDEPIEEVVESIEVDAPLYERRDRD